VFNFSIISLYGFSLIDKAALQATLSEWAFVRVSAVAFLIGCGPGCCIRGVCSFCSLREDMVVVSRNGAFNIHHARVTDFDWIAVENLVKLALFREMLVNEL
jgi:hypothetical protein